MTAASVWLVTGASSGIGLAVAKAALLAGDRVVACARMASSLGELQAINPANVRTAEMDLADPKSIRRAVGEAIAAFGQIDNLVNSAAFRVGGAIEEQSDESIAQQVNVNLLGAIILTNAVMPHMRSAGSGMVLHVGAAAGQIAVPGLGVYAATKWGLEGLCETLATEVTRLGIRICLLELGGFRTERKGIVYETKTLADYSATAGVANEHRKARVGKQPGDPDRLAQLVLELAKMDRLPLRIPIGSDAFTQIAKALAERQAWNARCEQIAGSTDYESPLTPAAGLANLRER